MKLTLNNFKKSGSFLILFFILSCEDVELDLPGNTQVLNPGEPKGSIEWDISFNDNNVGQLPEDADVLKREVG